MYDTSKNIKMNIFILSMIVLLCASFFSGPLIGAVYARYKSAIDGNDNARVAEFNITQEGTIFETIKVNITPNTEESVVLTIKNKSEVAVEYILKITNVTGNLTPLRFKLIAGDSTTAPVISEKYENGVSTLSAKRKVGEYREYTDTYTLKFVWDASDNEEDDLKLIGMVDYITISVTATQVN